jgi:hypothetical protein
MWGTFTADILLVQANDLSKIEGLRPPVETLTLRVVMRVLL